MTVDEWIQMGIDSGWCTPSYCFVHDGHAVTEKELEELDQGFDPCIHVLRLCWDREEQEAVVRNSGWLTH